MRNVLIAASLLVAFAGSADAAARHTWFYVDFAEAKCQLSQFTPEQVASETGGDRISPDNVLKDADGNLTVMVKVKINGEPKLAVFFSSKDKCETTIKDTGLKPDQAPSDEIN
jgi:hypothetical protein